MLFSKNRPSQYNTKNSTFCCCINYGYISIIYVSILAIYRFKESIGSGSIRKGVGVGVHEKIKVLRIPGLWLLLGKGKYEKTNKAKIKKITVFPFNLY